jgi:hypothetical protein
MAEAEGRRPWIPGGVAVLGIAVVAVALRTMLRPNVDVGWLLTVGEKVLDGQRLYVDVLETNPPASTLLYLPAILLARATGFLPERVLDLLCVLGTGLSLWLAGRALAGAGLLRGLSGTFLVVSAAAILLVVPLDNFGQREHIAAICLLPALAVMAARVERSAPEPWLALLAGLGAGITMAIKPHFVAAVAAPEIYVLLRLRSLRPLLRLENLAAAAVVLAYGAAVVVAFPAFLTVALPLLRDVYLPIRHYDLIHMLLLPAVPIWLATGAGLALCMRASDRGPRLLVPFLASGGFLVALLVQGKGWSYHGLPAVTLSFLTVALAVAHKIGSPGARKRGALGRAVELASAAGLAVMFAWGTAWFRDGRDFGALPAVLGHLAPHPKLIAISSDISIGHPLVREIGGTWVASVCSQWITGGVIARQGEDLDEATRKRLEGYALRDKAMLAADIRNNRPDVILIHLDWFDWTSWVRSDPGLAEAFSRYAYVETVGELAVWTRSKDPVSAQAAELAPVEP